jgi:hypothetical protein
MRMSEWITLSLAIITSSGVIVALILGLRTSRENRNLQIVRYKIELLDKISNWLANIQACISEDHLADDFLSSEKIGTPSTRTEAFLRLNWHRRRNAFFKIVEEGRNIFGTAMFFDKDLKDAVKSLEDGLQKTAEIFIKYTQLLDNASNDDDMTKIITGLNHEYMDSEKSIDKSIVQLIGEIFQTRVSLFDSISRGSDSF